MRENKHLLLNAFTLKLVAMSAVIIDHVALLFINPALPLYTFMRVIGRIAFVLYAFFISEGVIYTKNTNKYLLRIFYLYLILQALIIGVLLYDPVYELKNIFATLLAGASLLVYFERKEWQKVYYLLPFVVLVTINLLAHFTKHAWLIAFAGDGGLFGLAMITSFYVARKLAVYLLKRYPLHDTDAENETANSGQKSAQHMYNIGCCVSLLFIALIWYILSVYNSDMPDGALQSFSLISIPLLLLYNGRLGHSSKAWRIIYYAFYPVHVVLLVVVFIIINL
ncbi:MAG: TraX protein [Tenericutes bacterium ADurb.Bin087]|nr:MAG: TraX protein [Tenericutes bacterium ADurb.Bin087]